MNEFYQELINNAIFLFIDAIIAIVSMLYCFWDTSKIQRRRDERNDSRLQL